MKRKMQLKLMLIDQHTQNVPFASYTMSQITAFLVMLIIIDPQH